MDESCEAPGDEGEILDEYRDALRETLCKLAPDVASIHHQLEAARDELRDSGARRALLAALENLQSLCALLDELERAIGEARLPALDRFDTAVQGFVACLDRCLGEQAQPERVAACIDVDLLPVLDAWKDVEVELAAGIEIAMPAEAGSRATQ
jgi:hypothetical protein